MPTDFDAPENVEYPDLSAFPDDVTPEEVAALFLGRPIRRDGVVVVDKLEITDQQIERMLGDAGIPVTYEDDEDDE